MKRFLLFLFVASLPSRADVPGDSERPEWTQRSSYERDDRVYFVGIASNVANREDGRKKSLEAARGEFNRFLNMTETSGIPLYTQMTFEEKSSQGFNVYRLTWVEKKEVKELRKKVKKAETPSLALSAREQLQKLGIPYTSESFQTRAWEGDLAALKLFLDAGTDIDTRTSTGSTALMAASRNGRTEIVDFLLKHGANPNIKQHDEVLNTYQGEDITGFSPVMSAIVSKNDETVKRLLLSCPDASLVSKNGETALSIAERRKQATTVAILKKSAQLCKEGSKAFNPSRRR
jgi:hypothetical protein